MTDYNIDPSNEARVARRVTWVGFWCNAALGSLKVLIGILGHSGAVVADGIHSFSDFLTDLIVLVMVSIGRRGENSQYEYGHGKYETFGTMLVAVALIAAGAILLYEGIAQIVDFAAGNIPERPALITLAICVVSILVKEWLFRYTERAGKKINSSAVIANAWHHRSDALSSVATLFGVAGAIFLGAHWRVLDPVAQVVVAVMIIIVGIKSARPAILELLEVSLPRHDRDAIEDAILATNGVRDFHHLRTRLNGTRKIVDVHLKVDPDLTVTQAHDIATEAEHAISRLFNGRALVTTHIEPYSLASESSDTDRGTSRDENSHRP